MTSAINPFPDYPVVSLDDDAGDIHSNTIRTPAIIRAEKLTERYLQRWDQRSGESDDMSRMVMAIRGDYGSGKTHLLLYVKTQIAKHLSGKQGAPASPSVLAPCIQADPVTWYQTTVAPRLNLETIEKAVLDLYAQAGIEVASQVALTEAAVETLQSDPEKIYSLVRKDLLNESAVDEKFTALLEKYCSKASDDTQKVLASLLRPETSSPAGKWLRGETLNSVQLDSLGVTSKIDNDTDVTDTLVAIASLLSETNRPFVLMIDELEHFTGQDKLSGGKRNITWLKRLLESLARYPVFIIVSGHWSAWEATSDYLERFTPDSKIDIHNLTGEDVSKIMRVRVPSVELSSSVAESIATAGVGNIRRIFSLAKVLFDESSGFTKPVNVQQVRQITRRISQRISPDEAILRIHEIFEAEGYSVRQDREVASGVRFPLAVYQGDHPKIAVSMKHSVTQKTLIKHLKKFVQQLLEVRREHPDLVGYFVSDGAGDPHLQAMLDAEDTDFISFFDLATPAGLRSLEEKASQFAKEGYRPDEFGEQLRSLQIQGQDLEKQLKIAQEGRDTDFIEQLVSQRELLNEKISAVQGEDEKRTAQLEKQIERLEKERSREFQELQHRLSLLASQIESTRDASLTTPQPEEYGTRVQVLYEELNQSPSIISRLGTALSPGSVSLGILGIVSIIFGYLVPYIFDLMSADTLLGVYHTIWKLNSFLFGISMLVAALWLWIRNWRRLEKFLAFRAINLRNIYLRTESFKDLLDADQIFQLAAGGWAGNWTYISRKETLGALQERFPFLNPEYSAAENYAGVDESVGPE